MSNDQNTEGPCRPNGRYPYSPIVARPTYDWPDGRRLAVYIALNLEHFAFGEGLGAELAPSGPQPDILNYAWRDYGNRVGVWRLLDMFGELGLPASILVNSELYAHCPEVMEACRRRGDEIVGHGRTNSERQGTLDEAAERALIAGSTRVLMQHEGTPPTGWLGPWISESRVTPDLLAEAGYRYVLDWCMDDQPVMLSTRCGKGLLSLPYPQEVNDIPSIVARKDSASQFSEMIVDTFDEMSEQARSAPLVMGIALHPYIVGQPHRLRHLRRALRHIADAGSTAWIVRAGDVAADVLARGLAVPTR